MQSVGCGKYTGNHGSTSGHSGSRRFSVFSSDNLTFDFRRLGELVVAVAVQPATSGKSQTCLSGLKCRPRLHSSKILLPLEHS